MKSLRLALAVVSLAMLSMATVATAHAQAPACEYKLGFKLIADQMPVQLGGCLENEHHNPMNGDSLQRTMNGLLVWRKLDNFTAFTDGHRTWVNGPFGIQMRLNTERFDWEAATPPTPPAAAPAAAPTIEFWVDRGEIAPGQCVSLRWNLVNVSAAFLLGAGMDTTQLPGNADRLVCPGGPTTYTLNATDLNGVTHSRQLGVTIAGPSISFTVDKSPIARGQCVSIRWNVNNIRSVYLRGPGEDRGVTGQGDALVCPNETATYRLDITDQNGAMHQPTVTITVV